MEGGRGEGEGGGGGGGGRGKGGGEGGSRLVEMIGRQQFLANERLEKTFCAKLMYMETLDSD